MDTVALFKEYLHHLFSGRRSNARELIFAAHDRGYKASRLLATIIWPAMEQIDRLYRENHISRIVEHTATRVNRMIADQLQAVLNRKPKDGRRLVVLCGASEISELGAQIASDLFEEEGWSVWFVGSGVPNDEVLQFLGTVNPDLLMVYGSLPPEVPNVRKLIALVREVGVCSKMPIMVCGGIYNRVEDLAEEIKADLYATNVPQAMEMAAENPVRVPKSDKPEPGRRRKRRTKLAQSSQVRDFQSTEGGLVRAAEQDDAGDEADLDEDTEELDEAVEEAAEGLDVSAEEAAAAEDLTESEL